MNLEFVPVLTRWIDAPCVSRYGDVMIAAGATRKSRMKHESTSLSTA